MMLHSLFSIRLKVFQLRNSLGEYLLPHKLLPLVQLNSRFQNHENERNKAHSYFRNLVISLGISYVGYSLFEKRKSLKWTTNFNKFCPIIHALENENLSPRTKFNFLADVAEKTSPSVVYIEIVGRHPITNRKFATSNGSGFIVKSDGLILTNAHVVNHKGSVIVKLSDGREYEGKIECFDSESDLATVRINANNLPVLPLGKSSNLRPGEFVIAMGNPLTLSQTITAGVVSSVQRRAKELGMFTNNDYIQTDASVNVGNSGGPLVNLDCEAIGINTLKLTEGISLAIPSDLATAFLHRIEENKAGVYSSDDGTDKRKQKYLGVTMFTLTSNIIQEMRERNPDFPSVSHGVMIWRVMVNSPSSECGMQRGDIITAINGKQINHVRDVYEFLKAEDTLHIHIVRKKTQFDVTVQLINLF